MGNSRPWVRFWARMFDYLLIIAPLVLIVEALFPLWRERFLAGYLLIIWVAIAAWIPIEAWSLLRYGTTPGKALLNTRVEGITSYSQAFQRSFGVWLIGMGGGLPILAQLTQLMAYRRLKRTGTTAWDLTTKVVHRTIGGVRVFWFILLFVMIEGLTVGVSALLVRSYFVMEPTDLKWS